MVHSNIELKSNITLQDTKKQSSNTYTVSYVNFEGRMITNTYDRSHNNKKE